VLHNTANVAGSYYNSLKAYNSYSRRVLETAETYAIPIAHASWEKLDATIHQPLVEGVLSRVDAFGNHQLDKIEEGIHKVKDVAPKTIHTVENALHGTKVEGVLIKGVVMLDHVVDVLFPADSSSTADSSNSDDNKKESSAGPSGSDDDNYDDSEDEDVSLMDVSAPVYNKMKSRISMDSMWKLPTHTYEGVKLLANHNVNQCANLIQSTSNYLLSMTHSSPARRA